MIVEIVCDAVHQRTGSADHLGGRPYPQIDLRETHTVDAAVGAQIAQVVFEDLDLHDGRHHAERDALARGGEGPLVQLGDRDPTSVGPDLNLRDVTVGGAA